MKKLTIDVSENGEILVRVEGEEMWNVFPVRTSLDVAHRVIAGQTKTPGAKLWPAEVSRG